VVFGGAVVVVVGVVIVIVVVQGKPIQIMSATPLIFRTLLVVSLSFRDFADGA